MRDGRVDCVKGGRGINKDAASRICKRPERAHEQHRVGSLVAAQDIAPHAEASLTLEPHALRSALVIHTHLYQIGDRNDRRQALVVGMTKGQRVGVKNNELGHHAATPAESAHAQRPQGSRRADRAAVARAREVRVQGVFVKNGNCQSEDTLIAANNYANSLLGLNHFEEARSLLRKMTAVARRVLGEGDDTTLRMRCLYADVLYKADATLDDLREAVTTLEEIERTARRVLGGAHPTTETIGLNLRETRAVLRARETPSPP